MHIHAMYSFQEYAKASCINVLKGITAGIKEVRPLITRIRAPHGLEQGRAVGIDLYSGDYQWFDGKNDYTYMATCMLFTYETHSWGQSPTQPSTTPGGRARISQSLELKLSSYNAKYQWWKNTLKMLKNTHLRFLFSLSMNRNEIKLTNII